MALSDYGSAIVTGASSGIGAAVVRKLRARGLTVHAMARRQQRLDALAEETGCVTHVLDVRDTARTFEIINGLDADIIVNNAVAAASGNYTKPHSKTSTRLSIPMCVQPFTFCVPASRVCWREIAGTW
jgi:NADP-dependent 3-hydroxy acid dehydrogenase YdfG